VRSKGKARRKWRRLSLSTAASDPRYQPQETVPIIVQSGKRNQRAWKISIVGLDSFEKKRRETL